MFSPAVGRVARCANTFSASPASCLVRVALTPAPPQPFRPSHQRRLSSSKPSTPPNSKKKATELDQNATAKLEGSTRGSKGAKRKLKAPSSATSGTNVPFVAPTNHLRVDGTWLLCMSDYARLLICRRRQHVSLLWPPPAHIHLEIAARRHIHCPV